MNVETAAQKLPLVVLSQSTALAAMSIDLLLDSFDAKIFGYGRDLKRKSLDY
ncbi:MAG: hypothetical protein Q8M37_05260 [Nevskia sp.]|nr:hypothetical protein [Nevskia sp.]